MTSTVQHSDTRQAKPVMERSAPEGGFKRVALPAVAAALQTMGRAKGRQPAWQDCQDTPRRAGQPR